MTPLLHWLASLLGTVALTLSVSAYTDGCGDGRGLTYSGTRTRPGVAACGPALYGRTLWSPMLPGKYITCLDRGSAITDGHVDVWMESEAEALEWGRRELVVLVLPIPAPSVMMPHPCVGEECQIAERRLR